MGRPLTGSTTKAGPGIWRASVPVRKGARKQIERSFGSEAAARRWVASQIDLLAAGADADPGIGSTPTPTTSVTTPGERPQITDPTSLSQYAEAWHWERYIRLQQAQPERAAEVWRGVETAILPHLGDILECDGTDARILVIAWIDALAGRPTQPGEPTFPGLPGPYDRGVAKEPRTAVVLSGWHFGQINAPVRPRPPPCGRTRCAPPCESSCSR